MTTTKPVAPLSRRILVALAIPVWIPTSLLLFWNFPGNDSHGEGPGHVIAHITWAAVIAAVALWFWRQRDEFTHRRASTLLLVGLFLEAGAQLLESGGAAIVWATGLTEDGDFAVHDFVAAIIGSATLLVVAAGALALSVAIARDRLWRQRKATPATS
ncbi:hypothetical protein D0Z08_04920 [Nocardioides immobilis]|uniref:Uncharacterized protein n=1 Tax=Nocardioides immobilis TaxID=2049295 RepID=A0A417Y737_9ACTN|nr:hypothetical protein [Nocardioides immobilis]RHW28321.1 hypothetical protein D0Z08_04920 [Nocardioides immobilis]